MAVDAIGQTAPMQKITSDKTASDPEEEGIWGKDGFTFADVLDIINPLQHIPVVSTIYRELTGDEISDAPSVLGGALFGGVAGLVGSSVNSLVRRESGMDIEGHIVSLFEAGGAALDDATLHNLAAAEVDGSDASLDRFFAEMSDEDTYDGIDAVLRSRLLALGKTRTHDVGDQTIPPEKQMQAVSHYEAIQQDEEEKNKVLVSG